MAETVRILTDAVEMIEVIILGDVAVPLTGKTDILLSVRRISDNYYLDFADLTFKNTGWTTRQQQMSEVSAVNAAGEYQYSLNFGSIVNSVVDDTYQLRVDQSPGMDAANVPLFGEIKVGQFIDDIPATLIDTNEIQGKLPSNYIMGSSVQTNKDDEIDDIKAKTDLIPVSPALEGTSQSILETQTIRSVTINTVISTTEFLTDLIEAVDGFWNRGAIRFISGQNEGIIRKLLTYTALDGRVILRTALPYIPLVGDTFNIIPLRCFRVNYSDIDEISDTVWDEAINEHDNAGSFGAKNQLVVPSENVNEYKANIAGLAQEATSQSIESKIDIMDAIVDDLIRIAGNRVSRSGSVIIIYEIDGITPWRSYDLANGERLQV